MNYMRLTLAASIVNLLLWFGLAASAGELVTRTCDQAILKYHPKLMVAKLNDQRTGHCLFRVDIPPDMASDNLTRSVKILHAALETTDKIEFEKLTVQLGPALVGAFSDLLSDSVTTGEFAKILRSEVETISACAIEAVKKGQFERANKLSVSCGYDPKESNFFFTAVHNNVTLEIVLPFA